MKISIFGWGKMGKELLDVFLESDAQLAWIGRNPKAEQEARRYAEKRLKRIKKTKGWTEEKKQQRLNEILVSADRKDAEGSDFVIETITEDLSAKQELFQSLEDYVDPECILLTNTSSIPLERIFEKAKQPQRCAGLHAFYPGSLIRTVEINYSDSVSRQCLRKIKELVEQSGRNYVLLPEPFNLLFSKLIFVLMNEAFRIYECCSLSTEAIDSILKENFMMLGIFEILNTTGNLIVYNCVKYFEEEENEAFYHGFKSAVADIHENYGDCTFEQYCRDTGRQKYERGSAAEHKEILERFEALYVNYMTQIFQDDRLDIRQTLDACRDILGIARNPEEILREMGEERIKEILSRNYEALPCSFYRAGDYRIWNRRKIN